MNDKQKLVLLIVLIIFNLLYFFGPRYKIVYLDATEQSFIKSYRLSPGYRNFSAPEHIIWPQTLAILIPTLILGPLFFYLLRDKK